MTLNQKGSDTLPRLGPIFEHIGALHMIGRSGEIQAAESAMISEVYILSRVDLLIRICDQGETKSGHDGFQHLKNILIGQMLKNILDQ